MARQSYFRPCFRIKRSIAAVGIERGVSELPSRALRILLVVNSFASSVTARNTVVVHRRLAQGHDVELVETNRRGHATRFAHDAARRGIDVVVGYGGDGTLNEVATGIAGTDTALGVLPGGSTNVFAAHARPARTIRCAPPTCSRVASTPPTCDRSASAVSTAASSASTPASATTPRSSRRSSGTPR